MTKNRIFGLALITAIAATHVMADPSNPVALSTTTLHGKASSYLTNKYKSLKAQNQDLTGQKSAIDGLELKEKEAQKKIDFAEKDSDENKNNKTLKSLKTEKSLARYESERNNEKQHILTLDKALQSLNAGEEGLLTARDAEKASAIKGTSKSKLERKYKKDPGSLTA